jgi:hypothetical protein
MHWSAICAGAQFRIHRAGLGYCIRERRNDRIEHGAAVIDRCNPRQIGCRNRFAVQSAIINAVGQLRQVQAFDGASLGKIGGGPFGRWRRCDRCGHRRCKSDAA